VQLFSDELNAVTQPKELSVSEISEILKITIEESFSYVRVKGEVSGLKFHNNGHLYFNLKDERAVINAVCWKGIAASLPFKPEEGMEVICTGKISIYAGRSNYQLITTQIEIAGEGALLALLEKRRKKLAAEGLFDESRKISLPYLPTTIGVITSPSGAVIRDIIHRIQDRFPVNIVVWPVAVQGQSAAKQIADAIDAFNNCKDKPDLIIIARGGGSLEDLMPFNEEIVIRAVADSKLPIISAVGHETDTTLIDYVSDRRAPTPTAAAEMAVPVRSELMTSLFKFADRLKIALPNLVVFNTNRLKILSAGLNKFESKIAIMKERISFSANILNRSIAHYLDNYLKTISEQGRLLESYHYKKVLQRGFAVIKYGNELITSSKVAASKNEFQIEFADGKIDAKPSKKTEAPLQGSLFE